MEPTDDKGSAGWRLEALDPPSEERTREIASFLRGQHQPPEGYPHERDAFFHWKLRWNVRHPGFASAMVANDTDRIVSLCTVTPKRFWAFGEERDWGEIGDTFTDAAYQRRGMFSALVNASRGRAQAAGFSVIYGLPNERSGPGYTGKLNFPIKADAGHVNVTLPLSSRAVATRLDALRERPWAPLARAALEHPTTAAASRALAWTLLRRPSPANVTVREESAFGSDYDELWRSVRPALAVAQVRDARYLTWRFRESPFPFRVYAARHRNGVLAGYVATLTGRDDHQTGLRRLFIADWLLAPADANTVGRALLQAALRPALDEGVDIVTTQAVHNGPAQLPWRRYGFMQRPWSKPVIIHRTEAGARLLDDPSPWHFTLADTDAF
jgi:GNAT superfamily N-acetyltransferase